MVVIKTNKLLLVIVTIAITQCTGQYSRVIGGYEAPVEYGIFQASLQNLSGAHVCGGAIISNMHIITAAHCVYGAEPKYIQIAIGTNNLDEVEKSYNVESIIIHEQFNYTSRENDLAIVKANTLFDLQKTNILKLRTADVAEGDIVTLTGFGAVQVNGDSSRILQVLNLTVFSQETCRFAMRYSREVTDHMFCTFTQIGEGTCHGDSGGPLIKDQQLVGLVSWGIPCAVGFPDVHTRIHLYINWIQEVISK